MRRAVRESTIQRNGLHQDSAHLHSDTPASSSAIHSAPAAAAVFTATFLTIATRPTDSERIQFFTDIRPSLSRFAQSQTDATFRDAKWSAAFTPTLVNIDILRHHVPPQMQDAFFKPPPPETPFEQAAGRPMVFTLQGSSTGTNPATASIGNMAHIFEQLIPDATQAVATREGQWAA